MAIRIRRREFIITLGGAVTAGPLAVRAQQPAMPVIGFVNPASPGGYVPVSAFLKGLDEVGFVDGREVTIEYHWADGHYERLPAIIADLVQRKVNLIVATSTPAAVAAKAATSTIPVVFAASGDPSNPPDCNSEPASSVARMACSLRFNRSATVAMDSPFFARRRS
jgi:putative ABC transport system substrate-binding protein